MTKAQVFGPTAPFWASFTGKPPLEGPGRHRVENHLHHRPDGPGRRRRSKTDGQPYIFQVAQRNKALGSSTNRRRLRAGRKAPANRGPLPTDRDPTGPPWKPQLTPQPLYRSLDLFKSLTVRIPSRVSHKANDKYYPPASPTTANWRID